MLCLDDSVLIVFIDYGNSESKPPNEIYPLIESLARLPAMTVACTLHEVRFYCWTILLSIIRSSRLFLVMEIFGLKKQQMHSI